MRAAIPKTETSTIIFLCGWPACGPADYGAWLADNAGFSHLDLESDEPRSEKASLAQAWLTCTPEGVPELVRSLLKQHSRWVVTDGSPVAHVRLLPALQAAGVGLWFLQAHTESRSRVRWLAIERSHNPEVRPSEWEKMATAIRSRGRELRPFYRERCVETLLTSGELLPGQAFAERLGLNAFIA